MKNEIQRVSIPERIKTLSKPSNKVTLASAWSHGLNVQSAFKREPQQTHVFLTAMLKDAVDYLDMNKSFRNERDYIEAVSYLIDHFPAMKIEEWVLICKRLKAGYYGKMYERLKLPEMVEIFKQHEGERAEYMERQHDTDKSARQKLEPITEEQRSKWRKFMKSLNLPESKKADKRWKWIVYPTTPDSNGEFEHE